MFCEHPALNGLLRGGHVVESGVVQSIACTECDTLHDAEIIYEQDRYGYYCPELGFIPVTRDRIRGLKPDLAMVVSGLADAMECRRRKKTPLQGETWRLGPP
jgi:hypothetical protein